MGNCLALLSEKHGKTKLEKEVHVRRKTQHLIQNLVHEELKRKVEEVYEIHGGKILGTGVSGIVRIATHRVTGKKYAMKTLHLSRIKDSNSLEVLRNEVKIMSELDHPNIVRLYEIYETEQHIFLIMELCTGGELLDKLYLQQNHHYTDKTARLLIKKILGALRYCHDHHIAHRDLKLENFLFESDAEDAELKLIDFGLSRHYDEGTMMHRPVGTAYYVAPEVLSGSYTNECDLWSVGVISYMLLTGRPPFNGANDTETLGKVRSGQFSFPADIFDKISPNAKDFISELLVVNHKLRMTAKEAQEHPWMKERYRRSSSITILPELHSSLEQKVTTGAQQNTINVTNTINGIDITTVTTTTTTTTTTLALNGTTTNPKNVEVQLLVDDKDDDYDEPTRPVSIDIATSMKEFHAFSSMKKIVMEIVAFTLRPEEIRDLRKEFEKIDYNNNGELTLEEISEALINTNKISRQEIEKIFADIDLDCSGKLSYHEFLAATMDVSLLDEEHLRMAFDRMDSDHTGYITKSNFKELIGCDGGSLDINRVFNEADLNHDGKIDFQDFCGMMKGKQLVSDNATYGSKKKQSLPTRISSMLRFPSFDRNTSDSYTNSSIDLREKIKKDTILEQLGENEGEYDTSYDEKKVGEVSEKEPDKINKPENENRDADTIISPGTPKISEEKTYIYSDKEDKSNGKKIAYQSPRSTENDDDDKTFIRGDESKEHRSNNPYGANIQTKQMNQDIGMRNGKTNKGIKYDLNVDIEYLDSPTSLNSPSYPTFDAESSDGDTKTPTNI